MATVNDLKLHLGSLASSPTQSGSSLPDSQDGTKTLGGMNADAWRQYLTDENLQQVGAGLQSDMKRFDLAKSLANQDLENDISAKSAKSHVPIMATDKNMRELTKHYFQKLGGGDQFNIDYEFGVNNPFMKFVSDLGDTVEEQVYRPLGDLIDFGFDNTVGNLAGFLDKGLGDTVKNFATGEDLTWIPSAAADIATWAAPGGAAWKIPALLAKGAVDNSKAINQAMSGRDMSTGEELDPTQRFVNALAGTAGTALTALPGAGVLKGGQRKAAKEILSKGDDAAKAVESATKNADEAQKAYDNLFTTFKQGTGEATTLKPGVGTKELKSATEKKTELDKVLESALDNPEYKAYTEATNALKGLDSEILPADVIPGSALSQPKLFTRLEQALENLEPNRRVQQMFGEAAKETGEKATKEAGEKAATAAANEAAEKTGEEAAQEAAQEIVEAATKEDEKPKGFFKTLTGAIKGKAANASEKANASLGDILKGNALMYGNAALQGAAGMGSDFEGLSDLGEMYPYVAANAALGLVPGLRNSRIRAAKNYAPITPYSVRSDALGKIIQDVYNGKNAYSPDDIAVLQLLLQQMSPEEAIKTVAKDKANSNQASKNEENTKEEE